MIRNLLKKFLYSLLSVLPIALIVTILYLIQIWTSYFNQLTIISSDLLIVFLVCSLCLVVGMTLFSIGADTALENVGKKLGASFAKQHSLLLVIALMFLLGLLIVIAEPDVTVLASYVPSSVINPNLIKIAIAVGAAIFFILAFIRIMFQKPLKLWYTFFFLLIFGFACLFGDKDGPIIDLSFDSGAVTTGPITVPFFIAFGVGIAGIRGGKDTSSDSFGMAAMCSMGPILTMMILGLVLRPTLKSPSITTEITMSHLLDCFLSSLQGIGIALLPMILFFLAYNYFVLKLHKNEIIRILSGFLFTFVGLVIFLTAANFGFIPVGNALGKGLAVSSKYYPLLFIISAILGAVIILVEPGVGILASQVEEVSNGVISKKKISITLLIGVSAAIILSTYRVIYAPTLSLLYYVMPIYALSFLLALIVPDIYTAIAFDAGEVASGLMASNFILPFILGISSTLDNSSSGFGVIGIIAAIPVLSIEIMGLYAETKTKILYMRARRHVIEPNDLQVIHFNIDEGDENEQ